MMDNCCAVYVKDSRGDPLPMSYENAKFIVKTCRDVDRASGRRYEVAALDDAVIDFDGIDETAFTLATNYSIWPPR